jgi:hypothetical protein
MSTVLKGGRVLVLYHFGLSASKDATRCAVESFGVGLSWTDTRRTTGRAGDS